MSERAVPASPLPSTETKVTSARPIMSAAAVAAVRDGLRTAFSRASWPVVPRRRAMGQPTTAAMGRTSEDEIMATPTNSASVPIAEGHHALGGADAVHQQAADHQAAGDGDGGQSDDRGEPGEAAAGRLRALADGVDRARRAWRGSPGRRRPAG